MAPLEEPLAPAPGAAIVQLLSVNVATPHVLGRLAAGQRVVSAIAKRPVAGPSIRLDWENLDGDRQADRRVHGGADKAVYAYPADHWPQWRAEEGRDFGPACP